VGERAHTANAVACGVAYSEKARGGNAPRRKCLQVSKSKILGSFDGCSISSAIAVAVRQTRLSEMVKTLGFDRSSSLLPSNNKVARSNPPNAAFPFPPE